MIRILPIAWLAATLAGAQNKVDPQFEYWSSCKIGSWVRTKMEMQNPQGQNVESETLARLVEMSEERVVVETIVRTKVGDRTVDQPPRRQEIKAKEDQKGKVLADREEEVTVGGKSYKCRYMEVESESGEKKTKTVVKAWLTKEVPRGAIKAEVNTEYLKTPVKTQAMEWEKK